MKRFDTLQGRLVLFVLLLFGAPLLVAPLVFLLFLRQPFVADVSADLNAELAHHARVLDGLLDGYAGRVQVLAATIMLHDDSLLSLEDHFRVVQSATPDFDDIFAVGPDGTVVAGIKAKPGLALGDRSYIRSALDGRRVVSEVVKSRVSGKPIVVIAAPYRDRAGAIAGAVGGVVDLTRVNMVLQSLRLRDGGTAFLVGRDGITLTKGRTLGTDEVASLRALAGDDGRRFMVMQTAEGTDVLRVARFAKGGEWLLVRELPQDVALAGQRRAALVVLLVNSAIVLVLVPFVVRFGRTIVRPTRLVATLSGRIAAGDFQPECEFVDLAAAPVEIRQLYKNFCTMSARLGEHMRALERMAVTDQLTGLHNRRYVAVEGAKVVDVCWRGGRPCSCLMADIDRFKTINDTYGHEAGDAVLQAFAEVFRGGLRWSDIGARHGGEEFVVIAPNADTRDAVVIAERLRVDAAALVVEFGGHVIRFTVSVGVASLDEHGGDGNLLEELLRRADTALYRAKAEGRDRVCVWREGDGDGPCLPGKAPDGATSADGDGGRGEA
ncbi:sensor domain-containing diguanylate cyclase [Nitratidesulfovibrio vulgaris]|uniref:diguanylate cyclase n=1 Tax=Nitratidesulfovibrio vulgaris (strain ATCC 29579 / DSM 644 / CCUG 34227 / NCIMB 8303 / VKM B-1760 / Hildenborough) TaxID=882 RepID=Q728N3_NITV2|nr:sensor domain-containing diguanylate cyclase [Nitratidesulfovibrio vulgaris]AAS97042.1 GGDEF domain/HAMP domain protein [Nitratidesulfovibrio vulgaris str. Hildenborough]ADP87516.1 diguanylate cyclase [Nitratidesulfovibrio vulgaris RCH1]